MIIIIIIKNNINNYNNVSMFKKVSSSGQSTHSVVVRPLAFHL